MAHSPQPVHPSHPFHPTLEARIDSTEGYFVDMYFCLCHHSHFCRYMSIIETSSRGGQKGNIGFIEPSCCLLSIAMDISHPKPPMHCIATTETRTTNHARRHGLYDIWLVLTYNNMSKQTNLFEQFPCGTRSSSSGKISYFYPPLSPQSSPEVYRWKVFQDGSMKHARAIL